MSKEKSEFTGMAVIETIPALLELQGISAEAAQRVNSLYDVMTSTTVGMEDADPWAPEALKMRHPISSDPMMPQGTEVGDLYANGNLLWSKNRDGQSKPLEFVMCYGYQSRARFQQGESRSDCSSNDNIWNVYGNMKCQDCPDLPFRNGSPTACQNTMNMVILPLDLSGIYIVRFSKSSYRAGTTITKALKGQNATYNRTFGLSTKEMSSNNKTWNIFNTSILSKPVPAEVKLFAQFIQTQYAAARQELLAAEAARREDASAGLSLMDGNVSALLASDDDSFEDSM